MFLLTLKQIHFTNRPASQTLSYNARVKNWMGQWTVANNFKPILVIDEDHEEDALLVWAESLNSVLSSALSEVYPMNRNPMEDFIFDYTISRVEPLKEIEYGHSASRKVSECRNYNPHAERNAL